MPHLAFYLWALGAIGAYATISLVLDTACRALFAARQIGSGRRARAKVERHKVAALFLINTLQIAVALAIADSAHEHGLGGLYTLELDSPAKLLLVLLQSFFILLVFDANFFWLHRLAHRYKRIFVKIHAEHHRVRYPNVWHLQYQHPLDYLMTTAAPMAWIALLPIPLTTQSYLLAIVTASFLNIAGHCGYEVSNTLIGLPTPNGWAAYADPRRRWLSRAFNNVVHHDLHHQSSACNYSLYFTHWDRLCGTLHSDTDRVDHYVRRGARLGLSHERAGRRGHGLLEASSRPESS